MQSAQFELLQAIFYLVDAGMLSQHNPNVSQETQNPIVHFGQG
jgi:hypothetical protein